MAVHRPLQVGDGRDSRSMPRSTDRMAAGPPRPPDGFDGAAVAGPTSWAVTAAATPTTATVRNADGRGNSHTVLREADSGTGWTGRRRARLRPAGSSCTCNGACSTAPLLRFVAGVTVVSPPRSCVTLFGAETYGPRRRAVTRPPSRCCERAIRTRNAARVAVPETHEVAPEGGHPVSPGGHCSWVVGVGHCATDRDELALRLPSRLSSTSWSLGTPPLGLSDQPPMTPILTWVMSRLGGSLPVVRRPARSRPAPRCCWRGSVAPARWAAGGGPSSSPPPAPGAAPRHHAGHRPLRQHHHVRRAVLGRAAWPLARAVRTGENWLLLPAGPAGARPVAQQAADWCCSPPRLLVGIVLAGPRRRPRSGWLWLGRRWSSSAPRVT